MGAIAAAVDEMATSQKRLDLGGGKRVAGFDGRLACHHVEDLMQQFLVIEIEGLLFAALQKLAEEVGGVETFQKAGKCVNGDGIGTDGGGFDAEPRQQRLNLFEQFLLPAVGGDRKRDEKPLAFQGAARQPRQQVFVHDAFVQRVLVDDDQAVLALGDEIAVVKLNGGVRQVNR